MLAANRKIGFHVKMKAHHKTEAGNVEFATMTYNVGGGWDPFSHQFIAPVSGMYAFHLTAYRWTAGPLVYIMHQSEQLQRLSTGATEQSTSGSAVLHVNRGNHVYVRLASGSLWGQDTTHLTGYLLAEDP